MNNIEQRIPGLAVIAGLMFAAAARAEWAPVEGHIMTRWAAEVTPETAWSEHPRPQLQRDDWQCLNGLWQYAILGEDAEWKAGRVENADFDPFLKGDPPPPAKWDGKILVPFAVDSLLSGVGRLLRPNQQLWYRRSFQMKWDWRGRRVILHFDAVDWHALVWVNGRKVADNRGGYVPFECDITDALQPQGSQELMVAIWDPTNMGDQTIGKQALPELRRGFRYTPTTGIWQPVWLELVNRTSVKSLTILPDVDRGEVSITPLLRGEPDLVRSCGVQVRVRDGDRVVAEGRTRDGKPAVIKLPSPRLWSPDDPFLYEIDLEISRPEPDRAAGGGGRTGLLRDKVHSYFGMRKVSVGRDDRGNPRIHLNNKPVFQFGPLDQGYWPDGILTPPSDAAARFDVQYLREIGCNMVRVHIKVQPSRWYYWCDRLGLLVWQDFVCTRKFEPKITRQSASQWELEQERMIQHLYNHPSVIKWVVFNEGWGQYDTERLTAWAKERDPHRIVSNASGWADFKTGDIYDTHDYSFHPATALGVEAAPRVSLIGECGGHNVLVSGHTWHKDQQAARKVDLLGDGPRETYQDGQDWLARYEPWIEGLRLMVPLGLSAAVYTQITDVEHELNGWLTYDRVVQKIPATTLKRLHERLYRAAVTQPLGKDTQCRGQLGVAGKDWLSPAYDDSDWKNLPLTAAFPATPTPLLPGDDGKRPLALRLKFQLGAMPEKPVGLQVAGRGAFGIYLNGTLIKTLSNELRDDYTPVSAFVLEEQARKLMKAGANVLAIQRQSAARKAAAAGKPLLWVSLTEIMD